MCTTHICGFRGDLTSGAQMIDGTIRSERMIDGGSNVCVTGELTALLDVVDIPPIAISVALEGTPATVDDCITKRGLLPLTISDGSIYYQPCY